MPISRIAVAVAAVVAAVAALLWAAASDRTPAANEHLATTVDYLPGRAADVYLPERAGRVPVVVLVPGGGWRSADREGLGPLADRLAGAGMMAVNITYRAADDGVTFPAPVQDIDCAARFAAARADEVGIDADPLVVLGHSSGAHLAALVALAGDQFGGSCPWPEHQVDGLVGMAGPYDVIRFASAAEPLFGATPAQDPAAWREGNPITWVDRAPQLEVLLAHGTADHLVPPLSTDSFANALRDAGHEVRQETVEGADHFDLFAADVIAPDVIDWVRTTWPETARPSPTPS